MELVPNLDRLKVLVVEDLPSAMTMMKTMLRDFFGNSFSTSDLSRLIMSPSFNRVFSSFRLDDPL